MTGRELYEAYESAGPLLKPWEKLGNLEQSRWNSVESVVREEFSEDDE